MLPKKLVFLNTTFLLIIVFCSCSKNSTPSGGGGIVITPPVVNAYDAEYWVTKGDQSSVLQKQADVLHFNTASNTLSIVDVDSTRTYQIVDGFGFTLTGGSAYVINHMNATEKNNLLQELFGNGSNSIGISYLRISIGASDLNASVFSYDDVAVGQTDLTLTNFSLNPDRADLIPLLKAILLINPSIKILATPWSPPVWMKDNGSSIGGSLQPQYYNVYAQYFIKYITQMRTEGITIDAITPQNEPLNPGNNPSMVMTALQEANFIKNNLGPAFAANNLSTKIIAYDHNCDHPDYALTVLNDAAARPFVNGSAFHLYAGDISALSQVHNNYPDKAVYFTEQFTASGGDFGGDLKWHLKNVIIGSMRNWSQVALEWNLANDPAYGPYTPGGCTTCKGALTIGALVSRNVGYYIIAHASKFVPAGSVRIESNTSGNLQNVAFKTPAGKKVLIVENDDNVSVTFTIRFKGSWTNTTLPAGAVGTYVW